MMWDLELDLALKAARTAGEYLRINWRSLQEILNDTGRDVKLRADGDAEEMILRILSSESDHPILSEETGLHGSIGGNRISWIVDPLDGTVNYSRGLPLCTVSIGLWQGEHPILGVIYDVFRQDMYRGLVGVGAWCNDKAVHVSGVSLPKQAVIATGFPVNRDFDSPSLRRFLEFLRTYKKVRLLGSAALSLAYLSSGRVDVYAEEDIMLWDIAAGVAIVLAAGGHTHIAPSSRKEWARIVTCASNKRLLD